MDISNNKSFLAGALSALSGYTVVPSEDDDAQASPFNMAILASVFDIEGSLVAAATATWTRCTKALTWVGKSPTVVALPSCPSDITIKVKTWTVLSPFSTSYLKLARLVKTLTGKPIIVIANPGHEIAVLKVKIEGEQLEDGKDL